jgi:hypothetical protein
MLNINKKLFCDCKVLGIVNIPSNEDKDSDMSALAVVAISLLLKVVP